MTVMAKIVLHQWEISPFCAKVRRLLRVKGLTYETVDYGGLRAMQAARLSGVGKLPVLDYDGTRIQDSSDIAAFLEARHPQPALYPADPAQRGRALLLEDWADESLYWYEVYLRVAYPEVLPSVVALLCKGRPKWEQGIFGAIFRRMYRRKLREQGLGRQDRTVVESHLLGHIASLDAMFSSSDWVVGSAMSIADVAISVQIDEMLRTSVLAPRIREYRAVVAWLGRCSM
jgi:glutathione S-transferase